MSAVAEPIAVRLRRRVEASGDPSRGVESLVLALSDEIKTASNDQNVQRLARDLRAAAGEIAAALTTADAG